MKLLYTGNRTKSKQNNCVTKHILLKVLYIYNDMINNLKFAEDIKLSNSNIEFATVIKLKFGSIHEICGASNFTMAILTASKIHTLIIWIHEGSRIPFS